MSETLVTLLRELHTPIGIFTRGQVFPATKTRDGWLVHLLERQPGGPDHSVPLPAAEVQVRRKSREMTREWAAKEYRFAREKLGYGQEAAIHWLLEEYAMLPNQLRRLGIDTELGVPA